MCGRIQTDYMCSHRISRPLFCHRSYPTNTYSTGRPWGDRIPCSGMDAMMRNVEYRHDHWCCSPQCCEEDIRYATGSQQRVQQLYARGERDAVDLEDAVEEVAAAIERHDECQKMRDDPFAGQGRGEGVAVVGSFDVGGGFRDEGPLLRCFAVVEFFLYVAITFLVDCGF